MTNKLLQPELIEVCASLSKIPLVCSDRNAALRKTTELIRQVLDSHACTLTFVDLEQGYLVHVAGDGPDEEFGQHMGDKKVKLGSMLDGDPIDFQLVAGGEAVELYDLQRDGQGVANPHVAQRYGLQAALCQPLISGNQLIGYLNHFSAQPVPFTADDKKLIETLAEHVVITVRALDNLIKREQLVKLNDTMQQMSEIGELDVLLKLVLDSSLEIVGATRGWISRLEYSRGGLPIVAHRGEPKNLRTLLPGQGVTGKALEDEAPIRVDDVHEERWQGIYEEYWPDTRSELAIPILIQNARVRVGTKVELGSKPIGVYNVEDPALRAFSQADQDILTSLTRHAAILIEKLETDRKLAQLTKIQQEIVGKQDWDDIIESMLKAIKETLGFEYVNVSLIDSLRKRIRTEYVVGIADDVVDEFRKTADHSLGSNDIQADIVRTRNIEVPSVDDPRYDPEVFRRFQHDRLIRVFMPMIVPSENEVIGTVEAGYQRRYRKHVYERDIDILSGFVDYAVHALEQKEMGLLDKISHELRAPIVGIRSNASFLQRRMTDLASDVIQRKFDDILVDSEMLLYQVKELEHILGRPPPSRKIERTLVFRDIIIKTIRQLKPLVLDQGFETSKIYFDNADIRKIRPLYVDRAELNQVVFNLLINSIKYAEDDPAKFAIQIRVNRTTEHYVVSVKDWGIGIRRDLTKKVFKEGFRAPEAILKNPTGSGLGLYISNNIMHSLGGSLKVVRVHKPTEFQILLPRKLEEIPNDSHD